MKSPPLWEGKEERNYFRSMFCIFEEKRLVLLANGLHDGVKEESFYEIVSEKARAFEGFSKSTYKYNT
jgi:hypothetical protein